MTSREQLIAYLSTLVALAVIVLGSLCIAKGHPDVLGKMEVFGIGTVTGGLIGVLRAPSTRQPTATTDSGDVNVKAGE